MIPLPAALLRTSLNRIELLRLPKQASLSDITITVHRNHSFELTASVLNVFLAQSGLHATFLYSTYDDSLNFSEDLPKADLHLFWLDQNHYKSPSLFREWLDTRITILKNQGVKNILVAYLGNSAISTKVVCVNIQEEIAQRETILWDERLSAFSGTRLSNEACLEAARLLGMRYIPPFFYPSLKAIALDCDNTLYDGVLGEDGISHVQPRLTLQKELLDLYEKGFLLTLISKNSYDDVYALFHERKDFLLKWKHISAVEINWDSKPDNLEKLAHKLNIGIDSFVFLDDNPGELLQMAERWPEVRLINAQDETEALQGLRYCPLLIKNSVQVEDHLRTDDVKANTRRLELQKTFSVEEYRKELQITLTFSVDPKERLDRITDLLNKTNQFIFTYLRPNKEDVSHFLDQEGYCCVTTELSDKLTNSGLIALLLAQKESTLLRVKECVISCRALGRNLETSMIFAMLKIAGERLGCTNISFPWTKGPKNHPALLWIQQQGQTKSAELGELSFSRETLRPDLTNLTILGTMPN